jgi:outer membrane biosynthesis protein TonB
MYKNTLTIHVAYSLAAHLGVGLIILIMNILSGYIFSHTPLIDPQNTMEVSMVVLPRSSHKMPDRAARAPVPQAEPTPTPEPIAPKPTATLALPDQKPTPKQGRKTTSKQRDNLMTRIQRQILLDDLTAPEGPKDRNATDPNSDSLERIHGIGRSGPVDPEYARYVSQIQQLFMRHFQPLAALSINNPDLRCTVAVFVDPQTGSITNYHIQTSSQIPAFDAAAERAVEEVGTVPLPPEKYLDRVLEGYAVTFIPPQ